MKYEDIEARIREMAADQPRGWQAELARRLEISPVSVTQKLSGDKPRQIPPEQMHIYLDALGLELMIKPKSHE